MHQGHQEGESESAQGRSSKMDPVQLVAQLLDTIPAKEVWGETIKALPDLPMEMLISILENTRNENAPVVLAQIHNKQPREVINHLLKALPAEEVYGEVKRRLPRLTNEVFGDILASMTNEKASVVLAKVRSVGGTANHRLKRSRGEANLQAGGDAGVCNNENCAESRQFYKRGFNTRTMELLDVQKELHRVQEARHVEQRDAHQELIRKQEMHNAELLATQREMLAAQREIIRNQEMHNAEVLAAQREIIRIQEARNAEMLAAKREVIETLKELVSTQARYIAGLE